MSPQPLLRRVDALEKQVADLNQLVPRVDALSAQLSQFQTEVRMEFSGVRAEMLTLGETLRMEFRTELQELREALTTRMQVLHEDLISRIALLGEARSRARGTSEGRRRRR